MFQYVMFLEILSTYMTINKCDYPWKKGILDIVYSDTVTDSPNGSSQNNAGSVLILILTLKNKVGILTLNFPIQSVSSVYYLWGETILNVNNNFQINLGLNLHVQNAGIIQ